MIPHLIGLAFAISASLYSSHHQSTKLATLQEYEKIFQYQRSFCFGSSFPECSSLINDSEMVIPSSVTIETVDKGTCASTIDDEYTFTATIVNNDDSTAVKSEDTHFISVIGLLTIYFLTLNFTKIQLQMKLKQIELEKLKVKYGPDFIFIEKPDFNYSGGNYYKVNISQVRITTYSELTKLESGFESADEKTELISPAEDPTDIELAEFKTELGSVGKESELIFEEDSYGIELIDLQPAFEHGDKEPGLNICEYEFTASDMSEEESESDEVFDLDEESDFDYSSRY